MNKTTKTDAAVKAIGGAVPLRFVQIMTGPSGDANSHDHSLYGLTADGQVYQQRWRQEKLATPIKRMAGDGKTPLVQTHVNVVWWHPVPMSTEKCREIEEPAMAKGIV